MKPDYVNKRSERAIYDDAIPTEQKAQIPADRESNGPHTTNGKLYNAPKVRIRKGPSMHAEELMILKEGTIVEILINESSRDFYKVKINNGIRGYVNKNYCKVI